MDKQYIQLYNEEEFSKEFFDEDEGTDLHYFGEIGDINLLIGANNSRKSRFLRKVLKKDSFYFSSFKIYRTVTILKSECEKITSHFESKSRHEKLLDLSIRTVEDQYDYLKKIGLSLIVDISIAIGKGTNYSININFFQELPIEVDGFLAGDEKSRKKLQIKLYLTEFLNAWKTEKIQLQQVSSYIQATKTPQLDFLKEINYDPIITALKSLNVVSIEKKSPRKNYFPTLRTAVNLYSDQNTKIQKDIYKTTVEKYYKLTDDLKLEIHTGLDLFNQFKRSRNSRRNERKQFEAFEGFLQTNFFQGQDVEIVALDVANKEEEHISIYIGGQERNIYDLGDGIQALIILLYPIYTAQTGSWIFIEEPELNMHPGLQNLFLRTILTDEFILEKKLRYFITTHSNHLLYQGLMHPKQVSIFSFKNTAAEQQSKTKVRRIEKANPEILELLGVYNISVFMANCSIWVEGISDRRYLMAFLLAYTIDKQKYIEGLHYAFFEYAGSNIRHYNFGNDEDEYEKIKAHFLANKIFLLADKDSGKDKQTFQKKLQQLNGKNHFKFMTTSAIEIENVLSAKILKKFLIEDLKKDEEKVKECQFQSQDYKDEHLGGFLKKFKELALPDSIKEKSGTLTTYYKNKLSQFVLENVENGNIGWSDIKENVHAKNITEAVYKFIEKHNQ